MTDKLKWFVIKGLDYPHYTCTCVDEAMMLMRILAVGDDAWCVVGVDARTQLQRAWAGIHDMEPHYGSAGILFVERWAKKLGFTKWASPVVQS